MMKIFGTSGHKAPELATTPLSTAQAPIHVSAGPHGSDTSEAQEITANSPLPNPSQTQSRTLNVRYEGWPINSVRVLDEDNATLLYSVKLKMRKPHLAVNSASTGATIGTVNFHNLSSRIDINLHDSPIALTSRGALKSSYTYPSAALGGGEMTWKTKGLNLDLICLDERSMPVARFIFSNWSLRKCGTFEMIGPAGARIDVMEETLVTGLALVEAMLTLRLSTAIAVS